MPEPMIEPMICGYCEQPIDCDREAWGTLSLGGLPFMYVHELCWNEPEMGREASS
jgi:hypothetical protein